MDLRGTTAISTVETRLETLFQSNIVYQARDPITVAKDREMAGFFNARIVDLRNITETASAEAPISCLLPSSSQLTFESRFESGNLEVVSEVSSGEYNLLLQNDINTRGHTQWFFFKVGRTNAGNWVKFNIVNFEKPNSLFCSGMKVVIYSLKANLEQGIGWFRGGEDISYTRNGLKRKCRAGFSSYYTLSFHYQFQYTEDEVYFAYSCPYTYTRIQRLLGELESDTTKNQYFSRSFLYRKTLCTTLGGNNCDYLTITNPCSDEERRNRKGILLTARTHPGETVGSWVMEGILQFLTENSAEARFLRDKYVFRVLPMLNPDGVINGNYRCGLLGVDLNRRWKKPSKQIHPVQAQWKQLAKLFASKRDIELVCDLHGHSRNFGSFMYGCTVPSQPHVTRLFPYIISKLCPAFSYRSCTFGIHPSKETTLRVSFFKDLEVANVYTLETSFCGPAAPRLHFTTSALKEIGASLCLALVANYTETALIPAGLAPVSRQKALMELMSDKELLMQGEDQDQSGSDSDPSEDDMSPEVIAQLLPIKVIPRPKRNLKALKRPRKFGLFMNKSKSPTGGKGLDQSLDNVSPARSQLETSVIPEPRSMPTSALKPPDRLLRAYYNIKGKRVRDQTTQTPVSFYLSYKLKQQGEGKIEDSQPRTPHILNEKLQGELVRIEASISNAKRSLLEDLSLEGLIRPLPAVLTPAHPKSQMTTPQALSAKHALSHGRDLSLSFTSKQEAESKGDTAPGSKFQQLLGLSATPKTRLRHQGYHRFKRVP